MRRRTANLLLAVLAAGVVIHALHALVGPDALDSVFANWFYLAIEFGATALCFARAFSEPRGRATWAAIGTGMLLWSAGDLAWAVWLNGVDDPPYPSIADALYFASYAGLYTGIVLLLRDRIRPFSRQAWLDGLIGGLALAGYAAAFIFPAVLDATSGSATTVAVSLAYPLLDLLLLCFVVVARALNRLPRDRTWWLLGAGLVVMAGADVMSTYQESVGTYSPGTLLDSAWPLAMVLMAAAAWQPVRPVQDVAAVRRAWLPAFFSAAALGLLLYAGLTSDTDVLGVVLAGLALAIGVVRAMLLFGENRRLLSAATRESLTDGLTGLGNRRALVRDLEASFGAADAGSPRTLALFDLNGFKTYNDTFGHAAGDDLLRRMGDRLADAVAGQGVAYRLGGDEFCVLIQRAAREDDALVDSAIAALRADGEGFSVTTSAGTVLMPDEAASASEALMIADQRMYADKGSGEAGDRAGVRDVLLQVLTEREPDLQRHMNDVAELARAVGQLMGLSAEELDVTVRAAELHDVGKVAIPDAILRKRGPLDEEEWRFMRKHTLVGDRIVSASSAMRPVGRIVRSTHERWDGTGYPEGLAGEEIPLPARIVFACDAFDAMTSHRVYRAAMTEDEAVAELERCSGTQFDPKVARALAVLVRERKGAEARAPEQPGRALRSVN